MLEIKKVLCPTDFSDASAMAYGYAESLAGHYGATIHVIHVAQPFFVAYPDYPYTDAVTGVFRDLYRHAEEQLADFMRERASHAAKHGIHTEQAVIEGPIPAEIVKYAETHRIDLTVMGTHGLRAADRKTLGSVTERVLRKAPCPVLGVRKPVHSFVVPGSGAKAVNLRKILYCADFSEHSQRAREYAFSLAAEYGAEITILHVLEEIASSEDAHSAMAEVKKRLGTMIPPELRGRYTSPVKVRMGRPYQEIIQLADEERTDLIVMGVRGRNLLDLALFGSTTYRVIQLGPCPVLAVRT
jgi:nucleotide-binding universal stress UspA family protein